MTAIHAMSASELAAAYAARTLSPVEATQALLERIAAWEPKINAMYLVHAETALAAAAAAEARWKDGSPLSLIDGVPLTLKENVATKGDPMPMGTAAMPLIPKSADAPPAARLREAGAILLGKTTMPDFGMLSSGVSSVHGTTRNPWDTTRNPSGSSSGAAAAAVAGYAPLHVGTDIGGSVRLPAVHAGIFALKPSLGRIPIDPPYMGRVAGPMTRTVRDAALMLNAMTRPDTRDFMNLPYDGTDYAAQLEGLDPSGLRIGYLPSMGIGIDPHPEIAAAVKACADTLASAGAHVSETTSFLTHEMFEGISRFFEARLHADIEPMNASLRAKILPFIVEWATHRAGSFSGSDVMRAYGQVMAMRQAAVRAVAAFDFVISPVSPILPYEAEAACPGNDPRNAFPHIAFTVPFNMSEQPAGSINWSFSREGLPLGVQVVGQRFDDLGVMRLCRLIETMRPQQRTWPEPA